MRLDILENSRNYTCTVVQIGKTFPIEGADKIKRTVVNGNDVVIQNSVNEGDVLLYFVSGTKLSPDYCFENNLYDSASENKDTEKRGFISFRQKRVRAIKLRGIISDGMLMPLDSVKATGLKIGDEFNSIDGVVICEKWISPENKKTETIKTKQKAKTPKFSKLVENQFLFHNDTSNLRKNMHNISPNDNIGISFKKHGTSICVGNILTKKQLSWQEKVAKWFGVNVVEEVYDIIYSSRKVVKNQYINPEKGAGFYGEDIWGVVAKEVGHLIPKGFTLYGEVMGYLPSGNYIQKGYDYGCNQGEHKFYVYKISQTNVDGYVTYLSELEIKEFCEKYGLNFADTLLYEGKAKNLYPQISVDEDWSVNFLAQLEKDYNEKNCYMCVNKQPEEGIIVRKDSLYTYEAYKLKSKRFLLMESDEQEKGETNVEDQG